MTMLTTGKNTVDMDPELIRITFKVICKAGFGVSSLELDEKNKTNEGEMTLADALQVSDFLPYLSYSSSLMHPIRSSPKKQN